MTHIDIGRTKDGRSVSLQLNLANRHGLVTGATGGGKTVTLQKLAEGFSRAGVPVFAADIKGDLSGIAATGDPLGRMAQRAFMLDTPWKAERFPVRFWDLYGVDGIKIGTSVDEMGVNMMSRILNLNETQAGVLNVLSHACRDGFFPGGPGGMRSLECIHAVCEMAHDYTMELRSEYGHVTSMTIGMIQRQCLSLKGQNGSYLFREPAFRISDLLACDERGYGFVNLLTAHNLMEVPRLYSTFLLFLLTELFRTLPEVGDLEKPKLVFFFDEAHLLFANAPKGLLETIERLVRLIRSKGVGVYFVTQSPKDVPETVLAQLGNRFQHALRAFTPKDQKLIKAVAQTFRPKPGESVNAVAEAVTSLAVGECLISPLVDGGVPAPVERCMVIPPCAQVGPISEEERRAIIESDPLNAEYGEDADENTAHDMFEKRVYPKVYAWRQDLRAKREAEKAAEQALIDEEEANRLDYETNRPGVLGILAMMVGLKPVHPHIRAMAAKDKQE